jgi:phenylacetic acid degradation operon negative regulatory protein
VGSLIALLAPIGVTAENVRTALSRMTRRGWLRARRRGQHAYYRLTPAGRALLEAGRQRIYHPPRLARWDGRWSIVTVSIPERRRGVRDRLRTRLHWLGCGMMGNGVWISPHDVRHAVGELTEQFRGGARVDVFRGPHLGPGDAATLVRRCWDLDAIAARYDAFVRRWRPESCRVPRDCFARRFALVHEYRAFPSIDPYLPRELLPTDWAGDRAARVFERCQALLADAAEQHVRDTCALAPSATRVTAALALAV